MSPCNNLKLALQVERSTFSHFVTSAFSPGVRPSSRGATRVVDELDAKERSRKIQDGGMLCCADGNVINNKSESFLYT